MGILKVGSIIKSPRWPEPVEVKLVEQEGDYIHIVGATTISNIHIDQLIPKDEFEKIVIAAIRSTFDDEPWKAFLALETIRYRFASLYDPLLAMNASKVDPLPHQIECVYGYVLKLPKIRFLIADDPGAGKTIMAGLIIKELKLRGLAKRILIIVPGHLKDQWRRELYERFKENFVVIGREVLNSHFGENVWLRENQIITSIDFAKQEDILPSIEAAHFDIIVVDEAHKMSAYRYGEKTDKTIRYKLGEVISRRTEHLLFLTATPHKGDPENFRLFLDLLKPGFFATYEMVLESINNKDNPLFIRRVKEDLKDFDGKPIFLPRHVKTIAFNLGIKSPKEKELYNELSAYVNNRYNKALEKDKRRNVAFALVILQRRLASSTYALLKSLERRKKRLEELFERADEMVQIPKDDFDIETIEDLSEEERWKEEELWETLSVAENKDELKREISTIDKLISHAKDIITSEQELKLSELKKALAELNRKFPGQKVIIFTESKDTMDYLSKKVQEWGYTTTVIHGGMRLEERIEAEKEFKNKTQILVATEAAGEGINLQFCHLMINYDIPWNPNRLEQRMGRIHRYGQTKEVFIFNLVAEDTREGAVLKRLFEKIEEIRNALGSDKVFDVISEVFYGKNLYHLLVEAAANARSQDEILKDIDIKIDEAYIAKIKKSLGESLATRYIDYTRIKEMAQRAKEHRLIPEYTESYFKKAFSKAGGRFRERKDGFLSIESVPLDIRRIADENDFKRSFGSILKEYPKVTFDKDIAFKNPDAEFVTFGHPLFEAVMRWVEENLFTSVKRGATFIDPDGKLNGYILFYEGEIKDGTGTVAGKRLFSFYTDGENVSYVHPSIIWDLAEDQNKETVEVDIDSLKSKIFNSVISKLEEYQHEILKERERQIAIKQKYGIKSLEYIITCLDDELIDLEARKESGENVDLAIRNKQEMKKWYEKALDELKDQMEKERALTMSMPRFIGIIRVKPKEGIEPEMISDEEIERIGIQIAMEYERNNGRTPEDVSSENLGFDIRSVDKDGKVRYVEVKARAKEGAVALTQNEWFKAKRFQDDYYLYAVMNTTESPKLYIIQNPAIKLAPEEKVEVVRYVISFEEIATKGEGIIER